MRIAAHQPNYLPNLAYFYKMSSVDRFIVITNIQFEKQEGWQQRHKIKAPEGDLWLTVPVLGSQNQNIKDVKINNGTPWRKKQKRTLERVYGKAKGKELLPVFVSLFDKNWGYLADLNIAFISLMRELLAIKTLLVVDNDVSGDKENLLINICKKHSAATYVSGGGARAYMTPYYFEKLNAAGVGHEFIDKNLTPLYPYSTIHYLLLEGLEGTKKKLYSS